jgi:hypothetical protein
MENLAGTVIAIALPQIACPFARARRLGVAIEGNASGTPSVTGFRIAFGLVAVAALAVRFEKPAPDAGPRSAGISAYFRSNLASGFGEALGSSY